MNGTVVEDQHNWQVRPCTTGPVFMIEQFEQRYEVGTPFGRAGHDVKFAASCVLGAKNGDFFRLARRFDAKIASTWSPHVSEVWVRQSLRFILEQQCNVAGLGLLFQ